MNNTSSMLQISLNRLKEIVKKADEELGGTNGTVYFVQMYDKKHLQRAYWGTKEKYYKQSLSRHELHYESGFYYEHQALYFQIN